MSIPRPALQRDNTVIRIDVGGRTQMIVGATLAAVTLLLAYGPLLLGFTVLPELFDDPADPKAPGIGLWIAWAICMSFPVYIASKMTIRSIVEIDGRQRVVRIAETTCFLVPSCRTIAMSDIVDVTLQTFESDPANDVQPLPLPVIVLASGETIGIAPPNYRSAIPALDAQRQQASDKLVERVRGLLMPVPSAIAA